MIKEIIKTLVLAIILFFVSLLWGWTGIIVYLLVGFLLGIIILQFYHYYNYCQSQLKRAGFLFAQFSFLVLGWPIIIFYFIYLGFKERRE